MTLTASDAKERALQKVADLRRLSKELRAIIDELPLPSPEEFEAIRGSRAPWTPEAYMAAAIRDAEFHIDEARVILKDYTSEDEESLAVALREGQLAPPHIERSLRYLVEERSGEKISPTERETLYFRRHGDADSLASIFLGGLAGLLVRSRCT